MDELQRWQVQYIGTSGKVWDLTAPGGSVGIKHGGVSGLVGEPRAFVVDAGPHPGQLVDGFSLPPITGELTVLCRGYKHVKPSSSAVDVAAEFTADFATTGPPGSLIIGSPVGVFTAPVRINGRVSPPDADNRLAEAVTLTVPLIVDKGFFASETHRPGSGRIEVHNTGDAVLWPTITWKGQGGLLILPSGQSVTLPTVTGTHRVSLDPAWGMTVIDADGDPHQEASTALRRTLVPEGVPVGQRRTFTVPNGAELTYNIKVVNPWK